MKIFSKYAKKDDFYDEEKTKGLIWKIVSIFSKAKKLIIDDQLTVNTSYVNIQNTTKASRDLDTIIHAKTIADKELGLEKYKLAIERTKKDFQNKIETEFRDIDIVQPLAKEFETDLLLSIKNRITSLKSKIFEDNWSNAELNQTSYKSLVQSVEQLNETKEKFFDNENDLFSIEFRWFEYYNSLSTEDALIIDQLIKKEDWRKTFLIFYLNSMLVNSANMDLPTDDNNHLELEKSFSELEKEQIKSIREYWFSKQIDATKDFDLKHSNLKVENLFMKSKGSKHRKLSLREIVKFDKDLFTTFFPIILTTPDVASNLFKGQNQYFDIVMFDEASQLKLEDNLPALLKGKQIVIAGDEHQMPPSNYFSKIFDGTIDDEDEFEEEEDRIKNTLGNSMLDCESLLDFASILGFEKRHLDFHYRSRHPYLIDYSNYAFYNQRLKPLPNSFEYIPINYVPVLSLIHI